VTEVQVTASRVTTSGRHHTVRDKAKKPATSPAFPFCRLEASYLRLRAALRAALLRARVRAPLRADALRAALLPLRGAFFFAAAMLSLHDEVELSPTPWWSRRVLHRVLTGTRATNRTDCVDELASLLVTRREYRMQEMCVQYFLPSISLTWSSLPKTLRNRQVKTPRAKNFYSRLSTE
jgi:hypothetical protein